MLKWIAGILVLGGIVLTFLASTLGITHWVGIGATVLGVLTLLGIKFFNASSGDDISITR